MKRKPEPHVVTCIGGPRDGEAITVHDGIKTVPVADDFGCGDYAVRANGTAEWRGYWHRFGFIGPVAP